MAVNMSRAKATRIGRRYWAIMPWFQIQKLFPIVDNTPETIKIINFKVRNWKLKIES